MTARLQDLERAVLESAHQAGVAHSITTEWKRRGDRDLLEFKRTTGADYRYAEVGLVTNAQEIVESYRRTEPGNAIVVPWELTILYGLFGSKTCSEDFDARTGGSFAYAIKHLIGWLVQLLPVRELPLQEPMLR